MKQEMIIGFKESGTLGAFGGLKNQVKITLEGDRKLIDELYDYLREFKPQIEHDGIHKGTWVIE